MDVKETMVVGCAVKRRTLVRTVTAVHETPYGTIIETTAKATNGTQSWSWNSTDHDWTSWVLGREVVDHPDNPPAPANGMPSAVGRCKDMGADT